MDRSPARSSLSRVDSEDSPVEFITVADSDMSDVSPATPEKKPKKKRSGLSFKKIRSNAQKLIPGVRRTKKSSAVEGESAGVVTENERDTDTPSPPAAPIETVEPATLKSTESLPAIKEDPREVLGGTRSDEDMLAADGKARQKKVRKPSRAASFMKKLAGRAKSSKVAPNASAEPEADAVSSGTLETPLSIKRQTPEGAILNVSESELYPDAMDGDEGTSVDPPQPAVSLLIRQLEAEPRTLRPKRTEMKITLTRNTDDIEIIDGGGDGGGPATTNIETSNGRLRSAGGGGGGVHRQSPQNESSSLSSSAKPISPFPQPAAAAEPIATATTTTQSGAAIAKESFGVEQSSVTQSRPTVSADQQRLSSLLSGDYIAEINKFSIEKLGSGKEELPPPPVPSPRGSLSIREKFFHPLAPPSAATAAASSSVSTSVVVGGDESTEDFMRKSKGAAAAAGRSKGGGATGKGQASKDQTVEQSGAGGEVAAGSNSSGGGGAEGPTTTTTTTVRTQEASKPYQLGNSLKNPNNSGFKSIEGGPSAAGSSADSGRQDDGPAPKIVFDIGTQVRPDRTSTIAGQSVVGQTLTAPLVGEGGGGGSGALSGTFSSFGGSYDGAEPASDSQGDGSRRRIAYVEQPTFYTPEEEELLTGKASSLLSSALESTSPEYSLESADYLDSKMPPHGDLLLEKGATDREANMAGTAPAEKREHLYKILVIGELGTGKTSFIKRYVHQFFSQNYRATIGVDFALKVLNWDQSTIIRLQLWDIAGQERFGNMTRVYYKEAVGAFIVFDVTRSATFDAVIKWKQDLDSKVQLPDGKPIPCILLANKSDQQKQGIVTTPAKLDEYVKEHGFAGWFETSAKENVNIEEAAKSLVNKILMNDKLLNTGEVADSERFALAGSSKADVDQKKSCPC
ncbi:uncharacterized protein LOC131206250 isoform X2 [Anopheles bellator]|uniref:uncharacterized protein LOC131206250 isoform X2 n=1 Tax=Anopheles bellator TaxID=139047 RepID=UPI002647328E|nr:uncharacterized protein LOC131206250 isoform X2 [Anopheles bellator]